MQSRSPLSEMHWPGLSRRAFLKGVLGSAAVLGTGAAVQGCSGGGTGADGRPLLYLDESEAGILAALGEAVIPTQAGFPTLGEAEVIRRIDEELSFVDEAIQSELRAAIGVLQWTPLLYGRFSRYSRLDLEGRREILTRMMKSGSEIMRAVSANLKLLIHFFYFAHPAAWPAIGYDGPFSKLPPIASEQRQWYAQKTGRAT
jgi:hypothetical protein